MELKDRLKKVIDELNIPKIVLAKQCGIGKSQLYNYLNGNSEPTAKFLRKLKNVFPMVNIDWLVTDIGEPFKQTIGARYKDLREILSVTYDGKNKEKIFNMMEREDCSLLEKTIFLYTILTFLNKAPENNEYLEFLYKYATFINKDNVGSECEESRILIIENLNNFDRLFEIAQFGFEYNQPGIVFFFYQIFDRLELWDFDPKTMKAKIKLFNEEVVIYDPFISRSKQ